MELYISHRNDTITIPAGTPAKSSGKDYHYVFKGWQDKQNVLHQPGETIRYSDGTMVSAFGDTNTIKLTAVYQKVYQNSLV